MLKQVRKYCEQHSLIKEGDTVVVACSGGPDSMAMLDVLSKLAPEMGFSLAVGHLEHGIRGQESLDDAEFVRDYCAKSGIEFHAESVDIPAVAQETGMSLETAARHERYRYLQKVSRELGGALIATAHHRDDQAETVLMHILRGSGLTGLSGIRPKLGNVIRPLLFLSKELLLDYCYANRIPARMDRTNEIPNCTRNRIRLDLMPSLASSYNQAITEGLCHLAEIASVDGDYLYQEAMKLYGELVTEKNGRIEMMRQDFLQLHEAVGRRLLQLIVKRASGEEDGDEEAYPVIGVPNLAYIHIRLLSDFIENGKTGTRVSLPGDVQAFMDYGKLSVYKRTATSSNSFFNYSMPLVTAGLTEYPFPGSGIKAKIYEGKIPVEVVEDLKGDRASSHAVIDLDKCEGDLYVRTRVDGDRLQLSAGSKKLKDFFIDCKIPREERVKKPLVCDGRGILWVAGMKQTVLASADDTTSKFLVLSYDEGGARL